MALSKEGDDAGGHKKRKTDTKSPKKHIAKEIY
jgi:hypothetical protein